MKKLFFTVFCGTMLFFHNVNAQQISATPGAIFGTSGGARILAGQGNTAANPAIGFMDVVGNSAPYNFNDYGGGNGIFRPSGNTMAFSTSSIERMRINNLGNIGIGTTSPTVKLDVNGSIRVNNNDIYLLTGSDVTNGLGWYGTAKLFNGVAVNGPVLYGAQGGILGTKSSGVHKTALAWNSAGNVGIGINTPQARLHVAGGTVVIGESGIAQPSPMTPGGYRLYVQDGILTEKLKVAVRTTSNWADYVFAPDYQLQPLKEVEKYVNKHKHLPGVPSADEMVKNGLDVAKMDAKLLEKLEELTLYMIELNKQNQALQLKVNALEKQVANQ